MDEWYRRALHEHHVGELVRVLADASSLANDERLVRSSGQLGRVELVEQLAGGLAVTVSVRGERVRVGPSALKEVR